ncbi:MAG TPA: enolase C-terminal domain-like protein [Minicystis sp.]|nr:enolase C-terminal domain-like protein [Minicystis sp.]
MFDVPTDAPEADGTFAWSKTTLVVVEATARGARGLGYTYADRATAELVRDVLAGAVRGLDPFDVPAAFARMTRAVRNLGRPGVAAMAISAVDAALWDLKAKLFGVPLAKLLGTARDAVDLYGSGGFTSYSIDRLRRQLGGWAADGFSRVKMKVGTDPGADLRRAREARDAIGPETELFVDANGAYTRKQALAFADAYAALDVKWFEEPVSSDDLEGLRLLRDRGPAGMAVAAGEYGYHAAYFRRMLEAGAVDVLQADATRCGGITGFLQVDALCHARSIPLSGHCAPSLHAHVACAAQSLVHLEWFHDHVRIEHMLFDGAPTPVGGRLRPDLDRPGLGLELKRADAERFAA